MRGNEQIGVGYKHRNSSSFQIPMRGNETFRSKLRAIPPSKFQIPMRGNENDNVFFSCDTNGGFKSP